MEAAFAHPVEAELAELFDQHGVTWSYEPHTFVLERDADGGVVEAFTPDFFLPDLGIYVECTVMKQSLASRKRRKVRRASELAGVTVQILFRRDFERLATRWCLPRLSRAVRSRPFDVSPGPMPGTHPAPMAESPDTPVDRAFEVDVERRPDGMAVVVVEGDVDLHSGPALRNRLAGLVDDGVERIVVDLSDATFLDSMALGVLLGAKRDLAATGGELELVVTRDDIRRIFEITMLERIFVLHGSREGALRAGAGGYSAASSEE